MTSPHFRRRDPQCARSCRRDGGGGVCAAWTFCWGERRCHLLSRLPASLEAAQPGALSSLMGGNTYNAQCSSGYSKGGCLVLPCFSSC
jgi:hypothetical protein